MALIVEDDELCERCRQFDFRAIFDPKNGLPTAAGRPVKPDVEHLTDATLLAKCKLCRLFAAVRVRPSTSSESRNTFHLRAWSSTTLFGMTTCKSRQAKVPSIVLSLERGRGTKRWHGNHLEDRMSPRCNQVHGLILPVVPNVLEAQDGLKLGGQLVEPATVQLERLRGWLSQCDSQHDRPCGSQPSLSLQTMRLIDCDSRHVISVASLQQHVRYYALSYVWGAPDSTTGPIESAATTDFHLLSNLPQVVTDAMKVVKGLEPQGSRYLWIDRYCIDQGNVIDKHVQIRTMDHVYEGAYAVIVAAFGDGARSGLPGVGPVGRNPQPAAVVRGMHLVSTLPDVVTVIQETVWSTRGWTYQEAMLARRCIFFTEWQVYLVCGSSTLRESIVSSRDLHTKNNGLLQIMSRPPKPNTLNGLLARVLAPSSPLFSQHVSQYSQRTLTYDDDALNAFRGVLARAPCRTYWAIPILPRPDINIGAAFAIELGWDSEGGILRRRLQFPSWSWLGWAGQIGLSSATTVVNPEFLPQIPYPSDMGVELWALSPGDVPVPINEAYQSSISSNVVKELSQQLLIEGPMVKLRFQPCEDSWLPEDLSPQHRALKVHLCSSHLDTTCATNPEGSKCQKSKIVDLHVSLAGPERFERLWDAIILPGPGKGTPVRFLIVEWQGDVAQRVGLVGYGGDMSFESSLLHKLPKIRRAIRLA